MKRLKSPKEAYDHHEKWYDPESEVATQKLHHKLHDFSISFINSNPMKALHALKDTNNQMAEKGIGISDIFLHARYICALPDEYGHVKATLQAMKNRDRSEIIRMVATRYSTLLQKEGSQRSSRPPEQAFFSNKSGERSGARRAYGRSRGGTQGRGHGGSSRKGGCSSSGGGSSSASGVSSSSYGGDNRPLGRCWQCNIWGHIREECTTKESDFIAEFARCSGFGCEESTSSSHAMVLAIELPIPK